MHSNRSCTMVDALNQGGRWVVELNAGLGCIQNLGRGPLFLGAVTRRLALDQQRRFLSCGASPG
jgi:hypothetical protein